MDKIHDHEILDERKSLHDLANVLTLAQGRLQLLSASIKKDPTQFSMEDVAEKLDSIMGIMNRMADLLQTRREKISN